MIVVSNSSPLITLARIGQLELLRQLFGEIKIADEVRQEVVVRGAGRPAAEVVRSAGWIAIHAAAPADEMLRLRVYEKLQLLVAQGLVKKTAAKKYAADRRALRARTVEVAAAKAAGEQRRGSMLHVE